ncbi:MAG: dethiobiotin synthase [Acidiferrobacterales bacterium]
MSSGWFVTGTDTGVGKTRVSCALLQALAANGSPAIGMKPVASGCEQSACGLRSADAEALRAASSVPAAYEDVNPYAFAVATAPHLAARAAGTKIDIARVRQCHARLAGQARYVVVEGAGGWFVPITAQQTMADLAAALSLPVILVVGVRLGAISHALLTARAIRASGLTFAAWVANRIDPDPILDDYVEALGDYLDAPLLGSLPYEPAGSPAGWQKYLEVGLLEPA